MTKKQFSMIQQLAELLSSESVRDWTLALSQANPNITGSDVIRLKRDLRACIKNEDSNARGIPGIKKRSTPAGKFPATQEETSTREFFEKIGETEGKDARPEGAEFSKWLRIIRAQASSSGKPAKLSIEFSADRKKSVKKQRKKGR